MKSKLISIFLFFCLTAPVAVTFTWLHIQKRRTRKEVKHEIMSGIDKSELILLSFTKDEIKTKLHWKHDKEFEFAEQMYDVVHSEVFGDTTFYWCWLDQKESNLNIQLDQLSKLAFENNPQKNESQKRLVKFQKSLFYLKDTVSNRIGSIRKMNFIPYTFDYLSIALSPATPPPKVV